MICRAIRGTHDILPRQVLVWRYVEDIARQVFSQFGFQEIRTPIIEDISLFVRSLGQATDIVEKQMFIIERADARIVLRPEGTAGVVRAFCEHNLSNLDPLQRYFYIGPMFRGERPQKGRLRQFHHIGVEFFGVSGPLADVEVLLMLWQFMKTVGLKKIKIRLNSIGCQRDKERLCFNLRKALTDKRSFLCDDCQRRYEKNVLRILDCKNSDCRKIVSELSELEDYLCDDCEKHFAHVVRLLESEGLPFILDRYLVRGLDYYTRTVFEVVHPDLGKGQDALAAGGRYDGLVKEISQGRLDIPAVGFAIGVERLLIAMEAEGIIESLNLSTELPDVIVICQKQEFQEKAFDILTMLRKEGIRAIMDLSGRSMKAQMRWANRIDVKLVVLLGEEEVKSSSATVRNMATGEQQLVAMSELVEKIKVMCKKSK